jgi:hypothetical protein
MTFVILRPNSDDCQGTLGTIIISANHQTDCIERINNSICARKVQHKFEQLLKRIYSIRTMAP